MAIAKTCLQGPKFRVTPEEFNELEQLNSFQQLLYKVAQQHWGGELGHGRTTQNAFFGRTRLDQ